MPTKSQEFHSIRLTIRDNFHTEKCMLSFNQDRKTEQEDKFKYTQMDQEDVEGRNGWRLGDKLLGIRARTD